jgi:hypothetical protein
MTLIGRADGTVEESGGHAFDISDFGAWSMDALAPDDQIEVVADATNPAGSGSSLRFRWTSDLIPKSGTAIAPKFTGGPYDEIYIMTRIFYESTNGEWDTGQKMYYVSLDQGGGHYNDCYVDRPAGGFPSSIRFVNQAGGNPNIPVVSYRAPTQGISDSPIDANMWHNIELHWVDESSPGAGDGAVYMWVNGDNVGYSENITHGIGSGQGFSGMQWYATNSNPSFTTSYYRIGELYIAGKKHETATHPNEPEGYSVILEHDFSALPDGLPRDPSTGIHGNYVLFGGSDSSTETDVTAPVSPSKVFQTEFSNGLTSNSEPDAQFMGWGAPEQREIYYSEWIKFVGSDWQMGGDGIKLTLFGVGQPGGDNEFIIFPKGKGDRNPPGRYSSFNLQCRQQGAVTRNINQNVNMSELILVGQWQHFEMVAVLNDLGSTNGILKLWIDGNLVFDYSDITYITTSQSYTHGFQSWQHHMTWNNGVSGDSKSGNDYIQFDHLYLSGIDK